MQDVTREAIVAGRRQASCLDHIFVRNATAASLHSYTVMKVKHANLVRSGFGIRYNWAVTLAALIGSQNSCSQTFLSSAQSPLLDDFCHYNVLCHFSGTCALRQSSEVMGPKLCTIGVRIELSRCRLHVSDKGAMFTPEHLPPLERVHFQHFLQ
ncbi:unnamed protein product [Leptidea sinapis]|uniref:Uncharacterized protein n=1 Tax=Leptidea sinapis TaxID=189913 RepID=A0A5E4R866_9NEOP|nr:unnamed protein product [Leptidea sinapis]